LQEVISAARERGLAYLAITDHGPARTDGPKLDYFKNLNRQDTLRQVPGIRVLVGVEANITDTWGNLDMPEQLLHDLDIVIAGFHNSTGYGGSSVSENTQALIKAIEKNRVTVIAHIGDPRFPISGGSRGIDSGCSREGSTSRDQPVGTPHMEDGQCRTL